MSTRNTTRTTCTGIVVRTHRNPDARNLRRHIVVRLDDLDMEVSGAIPAGLREAAATLVGRHVQFTAQLDTRAGRFHSPDEGTVLPPPHLDRHKGAR